MNYKPVVTGNQSNGNAGTKACDDVGKARMETVPDKDYILLPLWTADPPFSQSSKSSPNAGFKPSGDDEKKVDENPRKDSENIDQNKDDNVNSTNNINAASTNKDNVVGGKTSIELPDDPNMPALEDIVYLDDDEDVGVEADMNNLDAFMPVSPIPTTRVHKDHPVEQIIRDLNSAPQTRRMIKNLEEHGLFSSVQQRTNHKDFQNCLFACFLSQEEPKKVIYALQDPSWIEAIQEELLQFKLQEVWTLVDLPNSKRPIGTKWVFRNKKDERGILIKNKARLMDVKSAFLYGKIEEEVYVYQPPGFEDPVFPNKVSERKDRQDFVYQKGQSQDKYVTDILNKLGFTDVKTTSTPMETQKLLLKDEDGEEVDVHLYRSMIGSLMYLTSSRPNIMFAVCACARYQVNPKVSHLYAVKRIFRYLKGQPKLGLWYLKDSPFDLVAYTDSDYAGASLDRKSTTGGCQFLGCRLISWQCKKQTVVANSTTEAEYVAASSCCGQVLWIQNQLLDYGHNLKLLLKVDAARHKLTTAVEATAKVKSVNGEVQLQALMDGKKIIVTKASVRCDLQLNYEEGMDCLPNATIFEELTNMGAKTTAWNKISSTMAFVIICLATNQKFNFSKYIFESMVKNLEIFDVSKGKGSTMPTDPQHTPIIIQPSTSQPQLKQRSRRTNRKDTELPHPSSPTDNVADEAVNEEMDDSLERVATIATSLDAEQDRGGGPKRQETMRDTIAQTGFENVSKTSNDSLLAGVNTPQSDEDRLKLNELMEFCTKLSARVISSDEASLGDQEDASKQGRKIDDINKDAEITLVDETQGRYGDEEMFDTGVLDDKVLAELEVTVKDVNLSVDEVTLAHALVALKSAKVQEKANVVEEPSESITTTPTLTTTSATTITAVSTRPKGKGLVIHDEEQATTPTVS
ncbi:putative ribonuclease H-like domain-containing protein [Tanacetum coccineum]